MAENEEFGFSVRDGFFHSVKGVINKPKGDGSFPVVFLLHGLSVNLNEFTKDIYMDFTRGILSVGCVVVRFNFTMREIKREKEDDANIVKEFHVESETHDLEKVLNYFHEQKANGKYEFMNLNDVCVAGHSYGATILALSANKMIKGVKALVFMAPKMTFGEYYKYEEYQKKKARNYFKDADFGKSALVHKKFSEQNYLNSKRMLEVPRRIRIPSMVIIGGNDSDENKKDAELLLSLLGGKKTYEKITGGDHALRPYNKKAGQLIGVWLKENI